VLIDWFTVIAQIFNFLILVALLKRFLYGPIVRAMDRREEAVRSRVKEAEQREEESRREAERLRTMTEELEQKSRSMIAAAEKEAEEKKRELIREAKVEAERLEKQWKESVMREKDQFLNELTKQTGRGVYAIARRVLKDMADEELQERIIRVFLRRVQESDLKDLVSRDGHAVEIRSPFSIEPHLQEEFARAIRDKGGRELEVRFTRREEMSPGIELRVPGRKIDWTVSGYVGEMEKETQRAIEEEASGRKESVG